MYLQEVGVGRVGAVLQGIPIVASIVGVVTILSEVVSLVSLAGYVRGNV